MALLHATAEAHAGDWIEVHGLPGRPARRGQILKVIGRPGHEHFKVRWDEEHESIFFPIEGVTIIHSEPKRGVPR